MKKLPFKLPNLLILFLLVGSLTACQDNRTTENSSSETTPATNTKTSSEKAIPTFEKLDQLPFSDMNQKTIRQSEEGDCENTVYRYTKDNWAVVLDSVSCSEYYRQKTFYQLNEAGDVIMVHVQYIEPFVDPDSETLSYALDEKIMDFSGAEPVMRSRVDTFPKTTSETTSGFDLFSRSEERMIQTKGAVEELDKAYWKKRYSELMN